MDVPSDDMLELDAWEFEEILSWEESFSKDGFISSMEDDERDEIIDIVLHNPYKLDDSFCGNIYKVE